MKKTIILIFIVVVLLAVGVSVYAGIGGDTFFDFGKNYRKAQNEISASDVVAEYKDYKIYGASVEYLRSMSSAMDEKGASRYISDRDIVNSIIENIIVLEEAERMGLTASDEEVEEMVNSVKASYDIPSGKEMIDSYCEGAGITPEQYFDIISEQLPRTIARQKLKDEFGKKYCLEHGIEFTKDNPPQKMLDATDEYIKELFEQNKKSIVYYIN
ncbi:MAG: SurA N-terminal domain-containing protein [Oscillospiraceae bacterium]|nr:SurA N-terminal domain-containing protein [Oscillospiraceae bacterium]